MLVGGEGTRLRPLTLTTPKPLLPIAGQPFLERQLTWLARHGVTEVILALGYMPDAFADHFPGGTYATDAGDELRLRYAVEPYPLGTAGGVRFAAVAGDVDERFVVCNGDVLTTLDLTALVRFHDDRGAEATIHLTRVDDPSAFGVVPTHDDGEVLAFVEKPPADTAPSDWINAGTYVLERSVLDRIPQGMTVSIERETFPHMLEHDGLLYALGTDDYWLDIGTPAKYLDAHAHVLCGSLGLPPAPGAQESEPGIWFQGTPVIDADAALAPRSLIGDGASIAAGARVVGSAIGPACRVGDGAIIERSVLLEGAQLDAGARVVESIVGPHARLGEGASAIDHCVVGAEAQLAPGSTFARTRVALTGAET